LTKQHSHGGPIVQSSGKPQASFRNAHAAEDASPWLRPDHCNVRDATKYSRTVRSLWGLAILVSVCAIAVATIAAAAGPIDVEKAGATKFTLSGDWLASGGGSIWLSDPPAKVVRQIDPSTGEAV
jgi:hypothetical protein